MSDSSPHSEPAHRDAERGFDNISVERLTRGRLEAFSDGVFAILITIMVLNLQIPRSPSFTGIVDDNAWRPLLMYLLSFVFLGIYWVNHHHMMSLVDRVTGGMLWANLHLLFWLSLIPFVTRWAGESHIASGPIVAYGVVSLLAAAGYTILQLTIIRCQGPNSTLAAAIGSDVKGKLSLGGYVVA